MYNVLEIKFLNAQKILSCIDDNIFGPFETNASIYKVIVHQEQICHRLQIYFLLYFTIWEALLICNYVWKINACDPIKIV